MIRLNTKVSVASLTFYYGERINFSSIKMAYGLVARIIEAEQHMLQFTYMKQLLEVESKQETFVNPFYEDSCKLKKYSHLVEFSDELTLTRWTSSFSGPVRISFLSCGFKTACPKICTENTKCLMNMYVYVIEK